MACMEEACCLFLSLSNGEVKPSLCRSSLTRALVTARRETLTLRLNHCGADYSEP